MLKSLIICLSMALEGAIGTSYVQPGSSLGVGSENIYYPSSGATSSGYSSTNSGYNRQPYNGNGQNSRPPYNLGEPVAFAASRADAYTRTPSNGGKIIFDRTETDVGYGWNGRSGVFVCQEPGVYVFSWSAVSPSGSETRVSLFKDGREAGAHTWSDVKGYQSASNTFVLSLRRGETVSLHVTEGRLYEPTSTSRGYTTFSGYKIN